MRNLLSDVTHWVSGLDTQGWILMGVAAIGIGLFCLRGFGSRSTY